MRKRKLLFLVLFLLMFSLVGCIKVEGSGTVEVKIYDFEEAEVFKGKFKFNEEDTLEELLKAHKTIKAKGTNHLEFGFSVEELVGIKADVTKNQFWNFKVNGEDSFVGVSGYVLVDGDLITFHLISWA